MPVSPGGNREYLSWPGTVYPGDATYPHHGTQADASTAVHSPGGWVWEEVTEGLEALRSAVDLAQGISRFVRIETSQLKVTDTAFINDAVIHRIWTRVITAAKGEFEQIRVGMIEAHRVVADEVRAGAIDGMVVTGALLRTAATGPRIEIDQTGLRALRPDGSQTVSINARTGAAAFTGATFQTTGSVAQGIKIDTNGWTTYQHGRAVYRQDTDGNSSWTSWDSGEQIRIEPLGNLRHRPTIVLDPPTGINNGWALRGGNVFVSKSAGTQPDGSIDFGVGALVLTGAEIRINQTGRADLVIGPGPRWYLETTGSSLSAANRSWVEADHGTVKLYGSTVELGVQGSGKANLRLLDLPSTSGGLTLTIPAGSTSWRVGYEGSARRLKMDIRDVTQDVDPARLLDVPVRSWADRWAWEQYTNYLEDHAEGGRNTGEWDDFSSPPPRVAGLVAEEVRDAGLDLYVYYRDGQVAALAYDRLWTLLIPLVCDLRGRVAALEAREEVEPDDSNGNGG